jgi:beta-glucosidase
MVDVARDSRWGRVSEGPGEDPYLASAFARSKIRGLQGGVDKDEKYIAACLKHYVAYGACESGRDYNTTSMATSLLYNAYLPPFQAAVEEGAATVMASFNDLNGVPCTLNKFTLRKILKGDWQFPGFVVSDANAIRECVTHGIAEDDMDAGIQSAQGGMDMDMGTEIYLNNLQKAVEEGEVDMAVIDEAVRRILSVKMWLGLFENPYVPEGQIADNAVISQENLDLALEAAEKSIVLLKNDEKVLPLDKKQKIALVGTLAAKPEEVIGAWAMSWQKEDCVSILDGLKNAGAELEYFPCGGPEGELNQEEIAAACAWGDVIVAVVGETVTMTGEASSKADISLPGEQRELLKKLLASGKKVVTLLMNGRPMALEWEGEHLPTLVECWHLGIQMGNAVAKVLFGEVEPEGRLASTFPKMTGQCPLYYNHPNTGRPGSKSKYTSRYLDAGFSELFPFGYGLSYTSFDYSDLTVKDAGDHLDIAVKLRNTGDRKGVETVQLYMQDVVGSIVRPVKELKGFKKVALDSGAETVVELRLDKADMGFYNDQGEYLLENGKFRIYVGGNSRDCLMQELTIHFITPASKYFFSNLKNMNLPE